jgi:cell division protein ZapA (FtsZ GTPase activity inhibitor)
MTKNSPKSNHSDLPEIPLEGATVHSEKLTLCGESLQLRTDQPSEVVQRLAGYINAKVNAAGGGTGLTPDNFRMLALASLGITGELFETKAKLEDLDKSSQRMLAKARSLTDVLDRALAS